MRRFAFCSVETGVEVNLESCKIFLSVITYNYVLKTLSLKLIYFSWHPKSADLVPKLRNSRSNFKQFYLVQVIKNDAKFVIFICSLIVQENVQKNSRCC